MVQTLEIRTLGTLSTELDGKLVANFKSRKVEALLVYLAYTGRAHPRELLAEFFWPDRTQRQSLANLRGALNSLRQELAPFLDITRRAVGLRAAKPVWVDALDLQRRLEEVGNSDGECAPLSATDAAALTSALTLYRGDFLEGFFVSDSRAFEDWAAFERDRLRRSVIAARHALLCYALDHALVTEGIAHATQLLLLDPLHEGANSHLMRLLAQAGQRSEALAQYEKYVHLLDDELGIEPSPAIVALCDELLAGSPPNRSPVTLSGPPVGALINPYKGLRPFQESDAGDFFGRDALVKQLLAKLRDNTPETRFLALVGPSGCGKSSVIKAGLIPALRAGALPHSERWLIVTAMPGTHPLEELEAALLRVVENPPTDLLALLKSDTHGLRRAIKRVLPEDDRVDMFLFVDQFEELFSLVSDDVVRFRYINSLLASLADVRGRVRVLITLRADFYDRPLLYPALAALMRERTELVLPLSAHELERVIVGPAANVGMTVAPAVLTTIVADAGTQPGALPLIQYALTELFEHRDGTTMTLDAYRAMGGVQGALTRRADEIFEALSERDREFARQIFLRLVQLGDGIEDTRRRVRRTELEALTEDATVAGAILNRFGQHRLLTFDAHHPTGEATVELAHEALIREWGRLRRWLERSRDEIRLQQQLASATADWKRAGEDSSYLLRGARLIQAEEWAASTTLTLTGVEQTYLDASVAEHQRQQDAEKAQQAHLLTMQKRAANRLRTLVAGLAAFLVVVATLLVFALEREQQAQSARKSAEREAAVNHSLVLSQAAVAELDSGNPDLALRLALEATRLESPPPEAVQALQTAAFSPGTRAILRAEGPEIRTVAIDPTGRLALTGSCVEPDGSGVCTRGELLLWDLDSNSVARRLEGHVDWVNDAVFSPDGQRALSASSDETLILWDTITGAAVQRFEGHRGSVNAAVFVPPGDDEGQLRVLSAGEDGQVILWDPETGAIVQRFQGHRSPVTCVAVRADARYVVAGAQDGTMIVWELDTGEIVQRIEAHSQRVTSAAFRSDSGDSGAIFYSSSADFSFAAWRLGTGQTGGTCHFDTGVNDAALTPDGHYAWVAADGYVAVCDLERWVLHSWYTPDSAISAIALGPNGQYALSGTRDGRLRLWHLGQQGELRRFRLNVDGKSVLDYDRGRMLTLSTSGPLLWNIDENSPEFGTLIRQFERENMGFSSVALHPSGRLALVGYADFEGGTGNSALVVYDVESGEALHSLEGHTYYVRAVAFSPDGQRALSGSMQWMWGEQQESGEGELILWDTTTWEPIRRIDDAGDVTSIAFSRDGTRAVISSVAPASPNYVRLLDVSTGTVVKQFEYSSGADTFGGYWVVFGPDDNTVLASSMYGHIDMWDIQTGALRRRFDGHDSAIHQLAISHDGRYLASSAMDGSVLVWNLASGDIIRRFAGHTDQVYGVVFGPDDQSLYTSSADGTVRIWRISEWSLADLISWTYANRDVGDFTCQERAHYGIEPLCE